MQSPRRPNTTGSIRATKTIAWPRLARDRMKILMFMITHLDWLGTFAAQRRRTGHDRAAEEERRGEPAHLREREPDGQRDGGPAGGGRPVRGGDPGTLG